MLQPSYRVALEWLEEGRRVVAATLVETVGSAPLVAGAEMLVDDIGRIEGSVTGGCVEGALVEEALDVGARTPAETAVGVQGEILALRAGRRGGRLAEASGPIHPRPAEVASS